MVIYTLHLSNHQLLIQPVRTGEQQQLASSGFEEFLAQSDEPVLPEGLRGGEVCSPDPGSCSVGGGGVVTEERRDRDSGRGGVADGAGSNA